MDVAEAKKKGMFSKIDSREDALKVVKSSSTAFFVVAALQVAFSFVIGYSVLIDAAIYVICGFFLRRFCSRAAAVILLLVAILAVGVTFANKMGEDLGGGNNIILSLIVLWAAIRAVEATFKLRGRFAVQATVEAPRS
jgi:hypothetical protein